MRCNQVDSPSHQYLAGLSMVPTHNSELGAAIALNMLVNDDEWKAEVYSCASDRQQAAIVFDVAVDMVKQSPALMKRIKIIPSMKRMVLPANREHLSGTLQRGGDQTRPECVRLYLRRAAHPAHARPLRRHDAGQRRRAQTTAVVFAHHSGH